MKQLYVTYINKQLFYTHSTDVRKALKNLRTQALAKYGRYKITELKVREGTEGNYVWKRIQLTRELLQQCCGHS